MGWGASSLFLGPPCRASFLACEAPPANTPQARPGRPGRPLRAPRAGAFAFPAGAGGSRTTAFRASQKRSYGLGLGARWTNCFAEWGPSKVWGEGTGRTQGAKLHPQGPARVGPGARRLGRLQVCFVSVVGTEEAPGVSPTGLGLQATEVLGQV